MKKYIYKGIVFLGLLLVGCDKFELSPYQTKLPGGIPTGLTEKNLAKIKAQEGEATGISYDTVIIAYTGDSQRGYDDLVDLVDRVNQIPKVDFLVLCGDIADFNLLQEYLWIQERLERLRVPYLTVIGNHDLIYDGGKLYTGIYGPKNYTLDYKDYTFLFHDTNSREYEFNGQVPNIGWLATQIKEREDKTKWFVGVSHVPPYDRTDFDPNLEMPYKNLFASTPNFILSLHGHFHSLGDVNIYEDHVRYMTVTSVKKRSFLLLKLINGEVYSELINLD